jgi:hypothetical protein
LEKVGGSLEIPVACPNGGQEMHELLTMGRCVSLKHLSHFPLLAFLVHIRSYWSSISGQIVLLSGNPSST